MREIKFRLFDKRDKRMIYPDIEKIDLFNLCFCGDSWQVEFDNSEDDKKYYGKETFEIMQFTGLLDKNGKEIYEGDIVKYQSILGVVEFTKDCAFEVMRKVNNPGDNTTIEEGEPLFREYEVIGNIYENPELLEPK